MNKYATGLVGAVSLLTAAATIGLASPASAQPSWEMPDVEGELLQGAWDSVVSATDGALVPETAPASGPPYEQINLTYWEVCAQSPEAGDEVSQDAPPELEVARPGLC